MKPPKKGDAGVRVFWTLMTNAQREDLEMYKRFRLAAYKKRIRNRFRERLLVLRTGRLW